jgi:hypothetical protein
MADWQTQELMAHREHLLRAGLPYAKVRRHVVELRDHYRELQGEAVARGLSASAADAWAEEQIGSLREIGERMVQNTRQRSFAHRHPRLLIALPALTLCAIYVFSILMLVGVLQLLSGFAAFNEFIRTPPRWFVLLGEGQRIFLMYLAPPLLALGVCLIGIRARLAPRYWMMAALFVSLLGASVFMNVNWPIPGIEHSGSIGLMLAWPIDPRIAENYLERHIVSELLRLLSSLLVCALFVRFLRRRETRLLG